MNLWLLFLTVILSIIEMLMIHFLLLFSDFSPPASPLSALYPSFHANRDSFGDLEPVPAWDWSMAWLEDMENQYRAHYPNTNTKLFDT